jgi:long-chain acyl-CoA synthetase
MRVHAVPATITVAPDAQLYRHRRRQEPLPAPLEDRLRAHPLISQVVVVGDQRPYAAALITLDAEDLAPWKRAVGRPEQAGPAELRDDPDLLARLQMAVDEANKAVSRAESIRRFRVLPVNLTEQNGYLTPTLKVGVP